MIIEKIDVIMNIKQFSLLIFETACQMLEIDADSVDLFKSRLDNFWTFQDVKYDYTVDLIGTKDRSEYDIESY